MAITPFKTFASGEVLTAADLNSSITTITNNVPAVNEANTWSAIQTYTAQIIMSSTAIRFAEGAAVASAATTNVWGTDGNTVHVTGTVTITSLGTAGQAGDFRFVIFDGALTLTHAANLNLPGSANITTAADDACLVYADTTTQLDVLAYWRKDGTAVVAPTTFTTDITMSAASLIEAEGAAVASAATTEIWATDGNTRHITGTVTITSLGTASQAGQWQKIIFDGALTLTHGANLNLPGSANITTAADDFAWVYADTTTQHDVLYYRKNGLSVIANNVGLQTIWAPAVSMYTRTTNGAASGTVETATSLVMRKTWDFDTTTQEFAQFQVMFPKSWNEGTVTFAPVWTAASGTGGVVWGLAGVALSDDDAFNTAFGTAQTSTDTLITAADVHVGPTSAAITIAGTPAEGDLVCFQVNRTVADGGDTLAADANLLGVRLFFTTNAAEDT